VNPFALGADEGELVTFGDARILIRATAESTGGAFSMFEELPPLVDTPMHVHARDDELFYGLAGEHVVQVGEREFAIGPGGMVFAPHGVPHSQRRVVPGEGRLLIMTTPGGFDGFFRELAVADSAGTLGSDAYAAASERYGITWI
jgi:mannose-6-phosphate isomerase-like protein (cupin superfamily)